jgi:hypothetical protein
MADEQRDGPQHVLSGFLTETTRRVRRTLLALSTVAIAAKALNVHLKTLTVLGAEIEVTDERWLSVGLFFVLLYFWVTFLVYALGDVHRSREALTRAMRTQPLLPGVALGYRDSRSAAVVMSLRTVLDVVVPMVYRLAGMAVLAQPLLPRQ